MKYFASDIIKKARIAADLVNSDFITWYEEVSLLNDTYVGLYQELIEVNDGSFISSFETTDNVAVLPNDFYQLKSVTLVRNGYSTPVLRRSVSESYRSLSYEIRNDTIYFYSTLVQMQGGVYRVEYYTTPQTLLFPPEKEPIEYNIGGIQEVLNATKDCIIHVKDGKTYWNSTAILNSVAKSAFITDKSVLITNDTSFNIYDINSAGSIASLAFTNYSPVIFEDGVIGIYSRSNNKIYYGNTNSNIINTMELPEPKGYNKFVYFMDMSLTDIWSICGNDALAHNGEVVSSDDGDILKVSIGMYKGGNFYGKDSEYDNIITVYSDNSYKLERMSGIVGIGTLDENSGLSYITRRLDNFYINPWVEDTLLDYPNSFFFQVMSYALAVQYKVKQNADASGLTALYNQYLSTFVRGANNDVYSPTRITNIYGV